MTETDGILLVTTGSWNLSSFSLETDLQASVRTKAGTSRPKVFQRWSMGDEIGPSVTLVSVFSLLSLSKVAFGLNPRQLSLCYSYLGGGWSGYWKQGASLNSPEDTEEVHFEGGCLGDFHLDRWQCQNGQTTNTTSWCWLLWFLPCLPVCCWGT